jgi:pimeloyl-ACP methyl ester carboxylesterase
MGAGSEALIIDGAGHWPHREGEDEFIARLITFLGAATG